MAIDVLGAERIDHGVTIAEDPALMREVAEAQIPLTVCPTSNVVIANRYTSLAEHPLLEMREHGLLLTINTDDPAMESIDLGTEYRNVANAFGLDLEAMRVFAREGIESTWLDESERRALRATFDAAIV